MRIKRFGIGMLILMAYFLSVTAVLYAQSKAGVTGGGETTWYHAEGATIGYDTYITLMNPNTTAATVSLTYMYQNSSGSPATYSESISVAAQSQYRRDVNDLSDVSSYDVSTKVESTNSVGIASERYMTGPNNVCHSSIGVNSTATTWYLAEGCTNGGFNTWVCTQNPGATDAEVKYTFMDGDGINQVENITVPAQSRYTIHVNNVTNMGGKWEVSTKIESTNAMPIIVERAMYGPDYNWAHCSIGVTSPATTWYLAEGSTGGTYETWLCIQNPNSTDAQLTLTYMNEDGETETGSLTVDGLSRETVHLNIAWDEQWGIATKIQSTNTVIVERAMYWNDRDGGHCTVGITTPAVAWYLPEGRTDTGYDTWICVQNPNVASAQVRLTFMDQSLTESTAQETVTIEGNERYTRKINDITSMANKEGVATKVESLNLVGIIAERSMYLSSGGGCCSIGAPGSYIVETDTYVLYVPPYADTTENRPLVVGFDPGANTQNVLDAWQDAAEQYKWFIMASKNFQNGIPVNPILVEMKAAVDEVISNYHVDSTKVIASGFSGGGQCSFYFLCDYPTTVSGIVSNCGWFDWSYYGSWPTGKQAVFLASSTDSNYAIMQSDKTNADGLSWDTDWIEFTGGHIYAPSSSYQEGAQWFESQW